MITLKSVEQIKGIYDNKILDFDRYEIEKRSPFSTKEYTIVIDFLTEEITGDCIAYGNWFDIEKDECLELLEGILMDNEPKRDFSYIIEKNKKKKQCHKCKKEQELDFKNNVYQDISGSYLMCLGCQELTSLEFDTDYFY